jgi:N-acetylglutamate synthase-like GNAT family acetyltransferase
MLIRDSFRDVAERFNLTKDNCPKHPSNCTEQWIESALAKGVNYYILENDKKPCGCVALEQAQPDLCYLERLAVIPDCRRKGFGQALVNHTLQEARKLGARIVQIAIIDEHTELKDWYKRLGFTIKNTTRFEHLPFMVTFMVMKL